jgi:hypothetical protein
MARITPLLTSKKTLNITYQLQETLLDTPETLPTSEPATPQIGYTVAEADLPTFSIPPYSKKWAAMLLGGGKFVTAGTLSWRIRKNGISVSANTYSVAANTFYTISGHFYDVAVNDNLQLALWSNQTDSNWDYKAFQIQVSRLVPINKPRLLAPCNFAALSTQPALTLGNPSVNATWPLYPRHCDAQLVAITAPISYDSLFPKDTYGLFQIYRADMNYANSAFCLTSATYRPYYCRNYVPTQIIMRGVRID